MKARTIEAKIAFGYCPLEALEVFLVPVGEIKILLSVPNRRETHSTKRLPLIPVEMPSCMYACQKILARIRASSEALDRPLMVGDDEAANVHRA